MTADPRHPWTLPNALSAFRLAMVPVLGALAWADEPVLFLGGLAAALLSDVADGLVARRTRTTSELGARLDSAADLATYATLPLFAWWLWPGVLRAEAGFLAVALVAFALPIAVGLARFGRITSYHTWLAKLSAWLVGGSAFCLFSGGPSWPFRVATAVLVLEALEEIAITVVLPRWRTDVATLFHALQTEAD